jgi:hypothetical protein
MNHNAIGQSEGLAMITVSMVTRVVRVMTVVMAMMVVTVRSAAQFVFRTSSSPVSNPLNQHWYQFSIR